MPWSTRKPSATEIAPDWLKLPSTSVRCVAAIFPESEVDRTRRGHGENGAHGAAGIDGRSRLDIISS
jgi:hypothetical protein